MTATKTIAAAAVSLLLVIVMGGILLKAGVPGPAEAPLTPSPGEFLWESRDFETILQGILILGGVFAILMLLKTARREALL